MAEGNKRYLGDVVINEENYERQRQFFNDIIENKQGCRGGTFNAYSLWDGTSGTVKKASDFATAEEGQLARSALQSDSVIIGANKRQPLINSVDPQHIYTDGVFLDDSDTELMTIDWLSNLDSNTLSAALIAIDNKATEIINMFDGKLDVDTYNDFLTETFNPLKESLDEVFEEFTDQDGDTVTKLNASLVNGIRFILTTQEKYDALPEATKKYWRNFFIIRDPNDIPPEYVDPMTWQLTDGYTFEVRDGYLCLNNGLSPEWKQICSLQDLLSGSDISTIIYNYIIDPNNSYIIPADNIRQSVSLVSPNDIDSQWRDYPFLSSNLHDDFIKGLTVNNSTTGVTSNVDANGFKNVNLDINSIIDNRVNPTLTSLQSSLNSLNSSVTTLEDVSGALAERVLEEEKKSTNYTKQIGDIGSTSIAQQLSDLNDNLAALRSDLTDLSDSLDADNIEKAWIKYEVSELKRTTANNNVLTTGNWYNPKTKLAFLYFSFHHYHNKNDAGDWVNPKKSATKLYNNNGSFVKAVPFSSIAAVCYNRPNHVKVGIQAVDEGDKNDGKIVINCDYTANTDFQVYGHIVYRYGRLR